MHDVLSCRYVACKLVCLMLNSLAELGLKSCAVYPEAILPKIARQSASGAQDLIPKCLMANQRTWLVHVLA